MMAILFMEPPCCYGQCLVAVQENSQQNIQMPAFMRKTAVTMFASSRRKKMPSLQYAQQVLENLRTGKFDHVVIKSLSKYRHGKVCKRRSVFICQKCKVTLHPSACFKRIMKAALCNIYFCKLIRANGCTKSDL